MKSKILNFYKTEHFLFRQWDRGIDDNILLKALQKLESQPKRRTLIIISYKLLKNWFKDYKMGKNYLKRNYNLFIVVDGKTLITCFYERLSHYQGRKDNIDYLLIQK